MERSTMAGSPRQFAGRVAMITGAAGGQGQAHAVALAREGAGIAAADLGDLSDTRAQIEAVGGRFIGAQLDVREFGALQELADRAVADLGSLDILVANAGVYSHARLIDLEEIEFRRVVEINLYGTWHAIRAAVPHMVRARYGRVVVIGSVGSLVGAPTVGHYSASKHALIGLTKTLALEHAGDGITANVICPGAVATPMLLGEEAIRQVSPDRPTVDAVAEVYRSGNAIPVPWLEPEDVTNVVLFAAAETSRYMTGSVLTIDMGYTAR